MPTSQSTNKKKVNHIKHTRSNQQTRMPIGACDSQNHTRGMSNLYTCFRGALFRYCYKCNHFSHKIVDYRLNIKLAKFIHRNAFSPLMENMVECYKYHNLIHITKFCRI